jgi:hypothetical protein
MLPHTLDDLFTAEADDAPAGDEFERHSRYLDRCRRVRLGPAVVVVFENSRTLQFRVQELARVARYAGADRVSRELDWYRSLLPGPRRLLASVTVRDRGRCRSDADGLVYLRAGSHLIPGTFLAQTAGDRIIGLTRWANFAFAADDVAAAADPARPLVLGFDSAAHPCESPPLGPDVRASLLADLARPDDN